MREEAPQEEHLAEEIAVEGYLEPEGDLFDDIL